MDYHTERVTEVITLYHLLVSDDISYVSNETRKFLKNNLFPVLGDENTAFALLNVARALSGKKELKRNENTDFSEINNFTFETAKRYQELTGGIIHAEENNNRFKIIAEQLDRSADEASTYYDKPLMCQLVCIWYIISSADNLHKKEIVDTLREKWKIKDDLIAEMADTAETLAELKENRQMTVLYMPKSGFSLFVKNIFRKNKIHDRKKAIEDEYRNDEQVLLDSIQQLFITEAIKG